MTGSALITIFAISSFLAANCQVVETINDFEIIELRRTDDYQQAYYTVPKLYKYLTGKRVEISYTNYKVQNVDEAPFFTTDFNYNNLEIEDFFNPKYSDILNEKGFFIIVRTNDCLIRFERDSEANFNIECDCQEL